MSSKKSVFLDVDTKLFERNLLINDNSDATEFEQMFKTEKNTSEVETAPWKFVTPKPGFCLKTTDANKTKVFLNLCHMADIPEPKDLTEEELMRVWQSDEVTDYRVPLSIQEPHDELDKSGKAVVVYDVAINTTFFSKLESSPMHKSFVLLVALEGIDNKYDVTLKKEDYIILKNRKCLGELRPHRIRIQSGPYQPPRRLIEELATNGKKPLERRDSQEKGKEAQPSTITDPRYRLLRIKTEDGPDLFQADFFIPGAMISRDISVDVGRDRIIVEVRRIHFLVDLFVPFPIDETQVAARFIRESKILRITAPLTD